MKLAIGCAILAFLVTTYAIPYPEGGATTQQLQGFLVAVAVTALALWLTITGAVDRLKDDD